MHKQSMHRSKHIKWLVVFLLKLIFCLIRYSFYATHIDNELYKSSSEYEITSCLRKLVFKNTSQPFKIIPHVIMPNNESESSILDHVSVIGMHSLIRLFL